MYTIIHTSYRSISHSVSIGICVRTRSVEPSSFLPSRHVPAQHFQIRCPKSSCTSFGAKRGHQFAALHVSQRHSSSERSLQLPRQRPPPLLYRFRTTISSAVPTETKRGVQRARQTPLSHSLSITSTPSHFVPFVSTIRRQSTPV